MLYSRNISDFWDVQTGVRYRQENLAEPSTNQQNERFDAVFGLHGLAPYFFETDAHVYVGEDDFVGLKLKTERDLLLTQKLIMQPFVELDVILNDQAANAKKTGLSHATLGLETRYELSKKLMPIWKWVMNIVKATNRQPGSKALILKKAGSMVQV